MPKKKVMIVDDDTETAKFIETLLHTKGYDPTCAYSGRECLEALKKIKPNVILLDVMMPEMDGWDTLSKFEEDEVSKDIPVIIVSAKDQPFDRFLASERFKVSDYITKPFDYHKLLRCIRKATGEEPVEPELDMEWLESV